MMTFVLGAMNNPYSNVYSEFHPTQGWAESGCTKTLSDQNTRRSDWETIKNVLCLAHSRHTEDFIRSCRDQAFCPWQ